MKSFISIALVGLASAQKAGRQTTAPVYSCVKGELIDKHCVETITVSPVKLCTQGSLRDGQCLIPAQRESVCPPGTSPTGAGCQIIESIPADKICPPNTHDIGGECQTYTVSGIVEVCNRGSLVDGQCELVDAVPPMVTRACPLGYQEAKGGCWKHAQMDCTPPHVGKRMLQDLSKGARAQFIGKGHGPMAAPILAAPRYAPAAAKLAVTAKQCEVKLEAPLHTTTTCPGGMEHVGNQCVTKTFEPTTIECSLGASHLCFPSQTSPANTRCPAGFQKNGELCTKATNVPKNVFCPAGTQEGLGGACYRAVPPTLQCPTGTALSGELCVGKEVSQPNVQVTVSCQGKNCFH